MPPRRIPPRAQQFVGHVRTKTDPHDEHDHQPDFERVNDAEGVEGAVGEQGQDDEGDEDEAHDGLDILFADAFHEPMQGFLPVQEQRHGPRDGRGGRRIIQGENDADKEHDERGGVGSDADAQFAPLDLKEVFETDEHGEGHHGRGDHPSVEMDGRHGAQRPQEGDQRKRANAGVFGRPFALDPDDQAQAERQGQMLKLLHADSSRLLRPPEQGFRPNGSIIPIWLRFRTRPGRIPAGR